MAPKRTAKTSPSSLDKPKMTSPKVSTKRVTRSKSNASAAVKSTARKSASKTSSRQNSSPNSPVHADGSDVSQQAQDENEMEIDTPSVSPVASRGRNKGKGRGPSEPSPPPQGFDPVPPPGAAPKPARGAPEYNQVPTIPTETGAVFVLGNGDCGQLGMGEDILERKRPMPLKVFDDKDIVKVAVGGLHSIALTKEGRLWSWGCNDQKALGRSGDDFEPGPVEGLDHEVIVHVACGDSISVALTAEGRVYTWGTFRNGEGILGFNKDQEVQAKPLLMAHLLNVKVVDVAVGTDHVLALTNTGEVYGWGNGQQCQLGRRIIPRRVQAGLVPERTNLKHIVKIGCGAYHSFAVSKEGFVYTWGLNNFQQCGLEADAGRFNEIISSPTIIGHQDLLGQRIRQCCGGEHHSAILREDGNVYVFGRADSQQLGLGYIVDPEDPTSSVFTLPDRAESEGAPAVSKKTAIGIPHLLTSLRNVETLSIGSNHNVAIQGGDAYAWGFGENYACGNGEEEDVPTPRKIEGQKLQNMRVIGVGAGAQHTVLLAQSRVPNEESEDTAMDTTN